MYRHAFDALSAAFGVIFVLIGLPLLFGDVFLWDVDVRWSWIAPIAAILIGGAVLFSSLRGRPATADATPGTAPLDNEPDATPWATDLLETSALDDEPLDTAPPADDWPNEH